MNGIPCAFCDGERSATVLTTWLANGTTVNTCDECFPPAMVNAIANAIGIDFDELPVTPDRVVEGLIQRRRKAKLARTSRAAS